MAKPRRSRRPRTTLVLLVLASITIITLDARGSLHSLTSGARSTAEDAFSPVRGAVNSVLHPIGGFLSGMVHYGSAQHENALLRGENGRLQQQLAERGNDAARLGQIEALDHLPDTDALPQVDAQMVAGNASNFAATIEIDKGTDDGVGVGMPVVGNGGLVGQVVESGSHTATVRLITDGGSQVGVTDSAGATGIGALAVGQGEGKRLSAEDVNPGSPVHKGDFLLTDGLQGAEFPAGIPVGTVAGASNPPSADQMAITVTPSADLSALDYVAVLQWEPQG